MLQYSDTGASLIMYHIANLVADVIIIVILKW